MRGTPPGFAGRIGLLRSRLLYDARPLARRRLLRLYRPLLTAGDLVIDAGAHLGNRARAFLTLGCRVVALEPQPDFARRLAAMNRRRGELTVLPLALGARPGRLRFATSRRTPTVATACADFHSLMTAAGVRYDSSFEAEVTTLDALIARFGVPAFVKLDIEGMEAEALAGLSIPLPALSFEHLPARTAASRHCLERLSSLGAFRFDFVIGERARFVFGEPLAADMFAEQLTQPPLSQRAGDIFAFAAEGR